MKAYTDIEQSKRLSEILPPESADMWYWEWPTAPKYNNYEHPMFHKGDDIVNVPCWSLAALLSVIPEVSLNTFKDGKWNAMIQHDGKMIYSDTDNPIDACYELIIKFKELNLL